MVIVVPRIGLTRKNKIYGARDYFVISNVMIYKVYLNFLNFFNSLQQVRATHAGRTRQNIINCGFGADNQGLCAASASVLFDRNRRSAELKQPAIGNYIYFVTVVSQIETIVQ
jgi:hypothetical protein